MTDSTSALYVRTDSEDDPANSSTSSPKKSTSLSSLRSLRDTFKRSESRTSQTSLPVDAKSTNSNDDSGDKKAGKSIMCGRMNVLAVCWMKMENFVDFSGLWNVVRMWNSGIFKRSKIFLNLRQWQDWDSKIRRQAQASGSSWAQCLTLKIIFGVQESGPGFFRSGIKTRIRVQESIVRSGALAIASRGSRNETKYPRSKDRRSRTKVGGSEALSRKDHVSRVE